MREETRKTLQESKFGNSPVMHKDCYDIRHEYERDLKADFKYQFDEIKKHNIVMLDKITNVEKHSELNALNIKNMKTTIEDHKDTQETFRRWSGYALAGIGVIGMILFGIAMDKIDHIDNLLSFYDITKPQ